MSGNVKWGIFILQRDLEICTYIIFFSVYLKKTRLQIIGILFIYIFGMQTPSGV